MANRREVRIPVLLVLAVGAATAGAAGCHRPVATPVPVAPAEPLAPPAPPPSPITVIERVGDATTGSTVALGKIAGTTVAFVADEDGAAVRAVDTATMHEVTSMPVEGRPSALLVTRQGQLWVTLRDHARVEVLSAHADRTLTQTATFATATEPVALAPAAGDGAVLVASGWGHALERFDATTFERSLTVDLPREPRAVIASRDGSTAYVAHAGTGAISAVHLADRSISTVDLGNPAVSFATKSSMPSMKPEPPFVDNVGNRIAFPGMPRHRSFMAEIPETFARQGYALARMTLSSATGDVERIVAPHAEMITGDPKVISSGYGGGGVAGEPLSEQFGVSTLDDATGKRQATRDAELSTAHPCRLPRAAASSGNELLVACLGGDEIAAYTVSDGTRFVRAIPVPAGPTGLAVDPETKNVYAFSAFDATLTELPFGTFAPPTPPKNGKPEAAPLPPSRSYRLDRPSPLGEVAERGRKIFHAGGDPRISKDGRACASCHPDGRDDGLVWSTPNGPRQTIFLAARIRHEAPFGWMAKHASLQQHMRTTMKNLKGKGLDTTDEDALAAYLLAMPGPPAAEHTLSAQEQRGLVIFESKDAECAQCHGGTDRSDHEAHDVKSASASDTTHEFLAPSLAGIGGTAPYFHDGRYSSLEQLLEKSDGKMGSVAGLSPDDKGALVAYLRTL